MPLPITLPMTRRLSLALPILFYLLALAALRAHLPTGDTPMLVVALLAGLVGLGIGFGLVQQQRAAVVRVCSRA